MHSKDYRRFSSVLLKSQRLGLIAFASGLPFASEAVAQEPFSLKPVTANLQDAVEGKQGQEAESSEYLLVKEDDLRKYIDQQIDEREKSKKDKSSDASKDGKPDTSMSGAWNKGLEFKTKDGAFRGHIGGRYQLDNSWFSADPAVQKNINVPYGDGVDLRRARLRFDGTMYKYIDYAIELDFVNSIRVRNQPTSSTAPSFLESTTTAPTDFWWQIKEVPWFGVV